DDYQDAGVFRAGAEPVPTAATVALAMLLHGDQPAQRVVGILSAVAFLGVLPQLRARHAVLAVHMDHVGVAAVERGQRDHIDQPRLARAGATDDHPTPDGVIGVEAPHRVAEAVDVGA